MEHLHISANFIKRYYNELLKIFNCINVGIYITDGSGDTLLVNDESIKTGGLSREQLIGKNMRQLLKEGYVTESVSLKSIQSGVEESLIQELGDGGQVFITGIPLVRNNKVELIISTERDITETIKLKEILKEKDRINEKYEKELEYLRKQNQSDEQIIAESESMRNIMKMALRLSQWETTILITGESGTGKEVLANFIYQNSNRKKGPFIKVNCSAIPENLVESELFGYESGSFTGAKSSGKLGFFELAHKGTLFLDEIGELPIQIQSKLLRALQEKEIIRIGGSKPIPIDVRIIAATNINLRKAITNGKFREDLYYRLNIIPLELPPLRNRPKDIIKLSTFFIEQFNKKYKQHKTLDYAALKVLTEYNWPGNIRELKNIIERSMLISDKNEITENEITNQIYKDFMPSNLEEKYSSSSLKEQIETFEKNLLINLISQCKTANEVSKILKVNKSTISKKMKKYGLKKAKKEKLRA